MEFGTEEKEDEILRLLKGMVGDGQEVDLF